jgi:hypothetical protein
MMALVFDHPVFACIMTCIVFGGTCGMMCLVFGGIVEIVGRLKGK